MKIGFSDISPRILKCSYFDGFSLPKGSKMSKRYVYDYEIEFFTESTGGIVVNGEYIDMKKGTLHFRRPGQYVQGVLPYSCYFICLDITGKLGKSDESYSIDERQDFAPIYSNPLIDAIPCALQTDTPEIFENLFKSILDEHIHKSPMSEIKLRSLLLQLLYSMYCSANDTQQFSIKGTPHYSIIKKSLLFIENNLQENISISQIATKVHVSTNYFQKIFADAMGITPNNYIIKRRMDKAKELLAKTKLSVVMVAQHCGFDRVTYFNYTFKKINDCTPLAYRKKYEYLS